jgi:hypothetical protein
LGVGLKVSPPPYEIFVKGNPPPQNFRKNGIFKEIFYFLAKKCHFLRTFLGSLGIITNLQ